MENQLEKNMEKEVFPKYIGAYMDRTILGLWYRIQVCSFLFRGLGFGVRG